MATATMIERASSPARLLAPVLVAALAVVGPAAPVHGQQQDPIVARAIQYLKGTVGQGVGESALAALAMVKSDVPTTDPALGKALGIIQTRFTESVYRPERGSGGEIYEAGVVILALANADAVAHRGAIDSVAQFLIGKQNPNGSWDYQGRNFGDTSISQYAVLGLWEAENAGIAVPPGVWDRAAQWYLSSQSGGGWTYHRDSGGDNTVSMTAAGVGSLLICERQLAPYRANVKVANPLLIPLYTEAERRRYSPTTTTARINGGIRDGIAWLAANFTTGNAATIGHSAYYALYGIERIGALADVATLGRQDWFAEGRRYIASTQGGDGSFNAEYGATPNTAWAVLFVTKSTAKTIRKIQIRRLGAGTLVGGRGLPSDLSQVSVAGGRVVARPMDGAVEGMLAVLEDPRVDDASAALAGLVDRYRTEGPKALRPYQDRFRKLLGDSDQGVRRVASWSLARTGDLAMAPLLIDALRDPDPGVRAEARSGLQLLARKVDSLGPPDGATPAQVEEAIGRWRAWYEAVRPTAGENPELTTPAPAVNSTPGPGPAPSARRGP